MPTTRRSTKESEEIAKNWQVDIVAQRVEESDKARQAETRELKTLIKELSQAIKESGYVTKEELDSTVRLIDERYGPFKKAIYWLAGVMATILISYFFQLFINISNGAIGQ